MPISAHTVAGEYDQYHPENYNDVTDNRITVRTLYTIILILYFISVLFLYPYGFFVAGSAALRVPDLFSIPLIILGTAALLMRSRLAPAARSVWPILPLVALEVSLPIIAVFAAGAGANAIANGLRMVLLWGPMLLYILVFSNGGNEFLCRQIQKIIIFSSLINLLYGFIQIFVKFGFFPDFLLITNATKEFAVDHNFHGIIQGYRASGFFSNSTGMSVFGILSLSYFLGRHFETQSRQFVLLSFISILLVLITLSRAALISTIFILTFYMLFLDIKRAAVVAAQVVLLGFISLALIENFIGISFLLDRLHVFLEFGVYGAFEDSSLKSRLFGTWPTVIFKLQDYPYGTLVPPVEVIGLVDSGYLTYYSQGKWVLVFAFSIVILYISAVGFKTFIYKQNGSRLSLLFVAVFLSGAMIISIPIRTPYLVFMLLYFLWQQYEFHRRPSTSLGHRPV